MKKLGLGIIAGAIASIGIAGTTPVAAHASTQENIKKGEFSVLQNENKSTIFQQNFVSDDLMYWNLQNVDIDIYGLTLKTGSLAKTKIPIMVKPNTDYDVSFTYFSLISTTGYGKLLVTDQNGNKIFHQDIGHSESQYPLIGGKYFKTNDDTIAIYISFEGTEGDGTLLKSLHIKDMILKEL